MSCGWVGPAVSTQGARGPRAPSKPYLLLLPTLSLPPPPALVLIPALGPTAPVPPGPFLWGPALASAFIVSAADLTRLYK